MKRTMSILMIILLSISMVTVPVSANEGVSVFLDGELLVFDVPPQIIDGRVMVPMRKIFEVLGATVGWDGDTQKITAKKQGATVVMQINSNFLSVNGNILDLDVPPQLVGERTLVPVRAIAESFEIDVFWNSDLNAVSLSSVITFDEPLQAFHYLGNWLIENGEAFGEYIYVGWYIQDGVFVDMRCYPEMEA